MLLSLTNYLNEMQIEANDKITDLIKKYAYDIVYKIVSKGFDKIVYIGKEFYRINIINDHLKRFIILGFKDKITIQNAFYIIEKDYFLLDENTFYCNKNNLLPLFICYIILKVETILFNKSSYQLDFFKEEYLLDVYNLERLKIKGRILIVTNDKYDLAYSLRSKLLTKDIDIILYNDYLKLNYFTKSIYKHIFYYGIKCMEENKNIIQIYIENKHNIYHKLYEHLYYSYCNQFIVNFILGE